jgi:hypothetical protein
LRHAGAVGAGSIARGFGWAGCPCAVSRPWAASSEAARGVFGLLRRAPRSGIRSPLPAGQGRKAHGAGAGGCGSS